LARPPAHIPVALGLDCFCSGLLEYDFGASHSQPSSTCPLSGVRAGGRPAAERAGVHCEHDAVIHQGGAHYSLQICLHTPGGGPHVSVRSLSRAELDLILSWRWIPVLAGCSPGSPDSFPFFVHPLLACLNVSMLLPPCFCAKAEVVAVVANDKACWH
jgi:hypothetical protein